MENATQIGMNRTGAQTAPKGVARMESATEEFPPDQPGDESEAASVRSEYIVAADAVGSVPVPGTLKGVLKTGVAKLAGNNPEVLIDKLGERLAFERTGTRLYELLMVKCKVADDLPEAVALDVLRRFHEEEARHFKLVSDAIERLGADPTAVTPSANVVGVQALGLMQVLSDPRTSVPQCLNAILTAELADHAGWEMLIRLAQEAGQDQFVEAFERALREESEHLTTIRGWVEAGTIIEAT